jgi:hypothetical protein
MSNVLATIYFVEQKEINSAVLFTIEQPDDICCACAAVISGIAGEP